MPRVGAIPFVPLDESRYRCCCGCCHVRFGTIFVALVHLLGTVSNFYRVQFTGGLNRYHHLCAPSWLSTTIYVLSVFFAGWDILAGVSLIWAVIRPELMWIVPHLSLQIALLLSTLIAIITSILHISGVNVGPVSEKISCSLIEAKLVEPPVVEEEYQYISSLETKILGGFIGLCLLILIWEIWSISIVRRFYCWTRDKSLMRDRREMMSRAMKYNLYAGPEGSADEPADGLIPYPQVYYQSDDVTLRYLTFENGHYNMSPSPSQIDWNTYGNAVSTYSTH